MCSGTLVRNDTAFMGFYAVEPDYQGNGIGRELWATTTRRLDESINIGLYGVPAMSGKYKKSGFKVEDSIRMLIFESQPGQEARLGLLTDLAGLKAASADETLGLELINSETDESILCKLIEFDLQVNKFRRERLLRNYLANESNAPLTLALVRRQAQTSAQDRGRVGAEEPATCCAEPLEAGAGRNDDDETKLSCQMSGSLSLDSTPEAGRQLEVLGYGCVRHDNTDGGMIGPIYAESSAICEVILRNLLERFEFKSPVGKYSAMSLSSNSVAGDILERLGLREMDQCSRMFTKFVPEATTSKIFYIHSPNFTLF